MSNAAATKEIIADDEESRKKASPTESAGPSLKHLDEAQKLSMDPETARLWPSCPPPRKEDSMTESAGLSLKYLDEAQTLWRDPKTGLVWACAPKSSEESDTGFPGTPPEDSSTESDAPPVEDSSKRPDPADGDGSSSSAEEANFDSRENVGKGAKRRKLRTSAAGCKPLGEHTLCRQHFILILLCIYSIIINRF
jgi:hypothetical protein